MTENPPKLKLLVNLVPEESLPAARLALNARARLISQYFPAHEALGNHDEPDGYRLDALKDCKVSEGMLMDKMIIRFLGNMEVYDDQTFSEVERLAEQYSALQLAADKDAGMNLVMNKIVAPTHKILNHFMEDINPAVPHGPVR